MANAFLSAAQLSFVSLLHSSGCHTGSSIERKNISNNGVFKKQMLSWLFLSFFFLFWRFGSFEIFLGRDEFSGLQGPSAGRDDIRAQLLDYIGGTFYPQIQQAHSIRKDRNLAFFREVRTNKNFTCFTLRLGWFIPCWCVSFQFLLVYFQVMTRTARLVAQWQCVGFCHGVLNTDNMSILGLTLDYGPFGFMERYAAESRSLTV